MEARLRSMYLQENASVVDVRKEGWAAQIVIEHNPVRGEHLVTFPWLLADGSRARTAKVLLHVCKNDE